MLAARFLGQKESGFLFLAMTVGHLAATVCRLGVERALTRLIAAELSLGQGKAAGRVLLIGAAATTAAGLVLGMAVGGLAPFAAAVFFHDPDAAASLQACAWTIPAMTLAFTLTFALVGLGRTVAAQILQNVLWPSGLLAGLLGGLHSARSLIFVLAASLVLTAFLAALAIAADRRRLTVSEELPAGTARLPSLWRTAWPLYVVELVQVSIASLPVMILGVFADAAAVSVFSIALRASMLVWVVLLSLSTVASPRFAALHRLGHGAELATTNRRVQLAGAILGGGLCLVLGAAAQPLLSLIGPGFAAGTSVLAMLVLGQAVNALYACQDTLLAMTGRGETLKRLNLMQLAVMLSLSFLLIPPFGAMGAAIATAVTTAQGALGTAMAVSLLLPTLQPRFAPPAPLFLRRMFPEPLS